MQTALWLLSFVYLSALSGWVSASVRDDVEDDSEKETTSLRRAASFTGTILGGTLAFAILIGLIEWLW